MNAIGDTKDRRKALGIFCYYEVFKLHVTLMNLKLFYLKNLKHNAIYIKITELKY